MTTPTYLERERTTLLAERAKLRRLCMSEWPIMTALVARQRNDRLLAIEERLRAIEHTKGFSSPGS